MSDSAERGYKSQPGALPFPGGLMRRTAVVCMLFAATFGITGTANAGIAAASPEAGTGSHVQTVIHNVRPAARPASKGPATPAIQGSAGGSGEGGGQKGAGQKSGVK